MARRQFNREFRVKIHIRYGNLRVDVLLLLETWAVDNNLI